MFILATHNPVVNYIPDMRPSSDSQMEEKEIVGYTIEKEMEVRALIRGLQDALAVFCQDCGDKAEITKLQESYLKLDAALGDVLVQRTLEDRYNKLRDVQGPCEELQNALGPNAEEAKDKCQELVKMLEEVPRPLNETEIRYNELVGKLKEAAKQKKSLETQVTRAEAKCKRSDEAKATADTKNKKLEAEKKVLEDKCAKFERDDRRKDDEISKQKARIQQLQDDCFEKEDEIEKLKDECRKKDDEIEKLKDECRKKDDEIDKLRKECRKKDDEIEKLMKECHEKDAEISKPEPQNQESSKVEEDAGTDQPPEKDPDVEESTMATEKCSEEPEQIREEDQPTPAIDPMKEALGDQ